MTIRAGVITRIYSSGMRGELANQISHGLMDTPVQVHSHGGRTALIQTGELSIDVAFLGVSTADELGNANGITAGLTGSAAFEVGAWRRRFGGRIGVWPMR